MKAIESLVIGHLIINLGSLSLIASFRLWSSS